MGHFIVKTNLLQPFVNPEDSERFSIIFVIMSEVNIVPERKQSITSNDFLLFVSFHCAQRFCCPTAAPPLSHPCQTAAPPLSHCCSEGPANIHFTLIALQT